MCSCSFLLELCFWSCLLGFCVFLFLLELERWRQRKCFVELARLIILLALLGLRNLLLSFRIFLFERRQGSFVVGGSWGFLFGPW
jgi:hypothetical protein